GSTRGRLKLFRWRSAALRFGRSNPQGGIEGRGELVRACPTFSALGDAEKTPNRARGVHRKDATAQCMAFLGAGGFRRATGTPLPVNYLIPTTIESGPT